MRAFCRYQTCRLAYARAADRRDMVRIRANSQKKATFVTPTSKGSRARTIRMLQLQRVVIWSTGPISSDAP